MSEPITKQRLREYRDIKRELENQIERIARMKSNETIPAIRTSDGSQRSIFVVDKMATSIANRLEYEERAAPEIEKSKKELAYIELCINKLGRSKEREVLRLRYIDGYQWEEVAKYIFGDDSESDLRKIYRIHGEALSNIFRISKRIKN